NSGKRAVEFIYEPKFNISKSWLKIFQIKNQIDLIPRTDGIEIEKLNIQININENVIKISRNIKEDFTKALRRKQPYTALTIFLKNIAICFVAHTCSSKEKDDLIATWKDFQSEFNLNSNNSEYSKSWQIVNRSNLISIWELLDSDVQETD
ncbi:6808_t:CDS:2, partial [Gigaspora rosea]